MSGGGDLPLELLLAVGVPDATILALTGHISRKMLARYSHTQIQAKLAAALLLDQSFGTPQESPQKSTQTVQ